MFFRKKIIFLDYASTTPLDTRVLRAMKPFFAEHSANPSSPYAEGVVAKKALSESRVRVAKILSGAKDEVFFTGSGTESNNLAIFGSVLSHSDKSFVPHIVTSVIEHPSVLEVCRTLEKDGRASVTYVGVGENGIVEPKDVASALRPETVLVSMMYANNEIGTVQPIREIAREIRRYKKENPLSENTILFHTDASQAANYLSLDSEKLGVQMMTLDSSKFYGPKGVGILWKKRGVTLRPIVVGGGQEGGLRSATENIPGIVGAALALEIAQSIREEESNRLLLLRNHFIQKVLADFPKASRNGDLENRLPNNINIYFPGIFAEFAVVKLDHAGLACSSASACNNLSNDSSSYVIRALQKSSDAASSSLRFTLGRQTTKAEMDRAIKLIFKALSTKVN